MTERHVPRPSLDIVLRPPREPRWRELRRRGELLERREPDPSYGAAVETYELDGTMWLIDGDLGEFRIDESPGRLEAWPIPGLDRETFERRLRVDWLPIFYSVWGWQALHAGAVLRQASGETVAFVGPSEAGKSTFAYALGQRAGWTQVTDDATAFRAVEGRIELLPIPSESRLRPASAERFGRTPWIGEPLSPEGLGVLGVVYLLQPCEVPAEQPEITRVNASRALQELLEQAFAFTLKRRELRQRMMEDYFTLGATVPAFRLAYRKSFPALETVLDHVEAHLAGLGGERARL